MARLEAEQGPESPSKRKQKKEEDSGKKKRVLKRRVSFSEGLREYDDAKGLKNPLREQRGPSITHARTIMNMMKSTRFPIPEIMINMPDNWDFFMDSLTANGYDSDEINRWLDYKQECAAPENSMESLEEIDFASSSDEEAVDEPVQEEKKEEKKEVKKKPEKVRKETLFLHGFDQNQLGAFPQTFNEGEVPKFLLKEALDDKFDNLGMVREKLENVFKEGRLLPSLHQAQIAYEQFCQDFRTTPLVLSDYFKDGVLRFQNQAIPDN